MSKFSRQQRRYRSNSLAGFAQLSSEITSSIHADTLHPRRAPTWGNQATQRLLRTETLQPSRRTAPLGRSNFSASAPVISQVIPISGQLIQRQVESEEEEEELLQPKLLGDQHPSSIQRKCEQCEQEDEATIQTKLRIGQPNDKYEQEADRVADRVMRMPEPSVQRQLENEEEETLQAKSLGSQITPLIQRQIVDEEPEEEELQAKELPGRTSLIAPQIQGQIGNLHNDGEPLPRSERAFFESRIGVDFSDVRIHRSVRAAESARNLNARAFTLGRNIVFGSGQYRPGSLVGKRLLAHELTHVVQQSALHSRNTIQRELIYGAAYPRPYKQDEQEIRNAEAGNWSPASIDFRTSVKHSGGGQGKSTFRSFLKYIDSKQKGSISELGLLGHANSSNFGLSGKVEGKNVFFTKPGQINHETIKDNLSSIRSKQLHNRFADNAKIILYGCNAGSGTALLDSISQAFKVCVEGFKDEIDFCFQWRPAVGKNRRIISRGRVNYSPIDLTDPLAGLEREKSCNEFLVDLHKLSPDQKSCKGVSSSSEGKQEQGAQLSFLRNALALFGSIPL